MGNWSRWTRGTSRSSRLANLLAPFSLFRSRHSTRRNAQSRAVTGMGPYSFFLCVCLKCWCGGVSASSHRGGRLLLLLSGPDSLSLSLWLSTSLSLSLSFPSFMRLPFPLLLPLSASLGRMTPLSDRNHVVRIECFSTVWTEEEDPPFFALLVFHLPQHIV